MMAEYASLMKYFYVNAYSQSAALCETSPTFPEKPLSPASIYRWFKKLEDRPTKSWQRCMRLGIMGQSLCFTRRDLAMFLSCLKNIVLRLLTELGYKNTGRI